MPLLGRQPFVREQLPDDLHPEEELFYCKLTHEVFREYEQFFDRVILCNSLVWTCAVTGKPGLTYQEAIESEKAARKNLKRFPLALRRPILFLSTLTKRGRLNDMCDDVFMFVKDRYFVGEIVEVNFNGVKKSCQISQVVITEKTPKSPNTKQDKKEPKSPNVKQDKPKKVKKVSPEKIKYEVVDTVSGKKAVVKAPAINRPKGSYTKPLNKLFIKQHTTSVNGVWHVKEEALKKYEMQDFKFKEVFNGPLPKYASSPTKNSSPSKKKTTSSEKSEKSAEKKSSDSSGKKSVQGKLNFKKETSEEKKIALMEQAEFVKQRLAAEKERQRKKEELKKRLEEDRLRLKEQRLKEREQKKEEKRIIAEYLNSWRKPRDDLECDDLKELPVPVPLDCSIPQTCFGDAVMVLEFLSTYSDVIQLKDSFPQGFTFEHLEKSLMETDIQGCFNDLLQLLLTSVFQLQDSDEDSSTSQNNLKIDEITDITPEKAMAIAATTASWPQLYHGTELRNMPMDSFSITEILRLHILASGANRNSHTSTGISEDPGLWFKVEHPELVKKLSTISVFQLSCEERVKILTLLVNQLLLCAPMRNLANENLNKARHLRGELKQLKTTYSRKRKEDAISKQKKNADEKEAILPNGDAEQAPTNDEEAKGNAETISPEEQKELEEARQKEEAREKAEFLRKERDLITRIRQFETTFSKSPIGRDRAYRRYWVFQTLPGIFVEDDDKFVGSCLLKQTAQIPTPNAAANNDITTPNIRKYLQHLGDNNNSDKENDILYDLAMIQSGMSCPVQTKDRKLTDLNPRVDFKKAILDEIPQEEHGCVQCKEKVTDLHNNFPRYCPHRKNSSVFGLCTACIDTCPVHNINAPRTKWSFYYKEEDLDELLSNLNPRGFRERALRDSLIKEKEKIKGLLAKCPYSVLNRTLPPPLLPEVRKSQRNQNTRRSAYADMKPEEALETTLRDMILELEHRIYAGALGSIKVKDREAWKTAIEKMSYDKQCEKLTLNSSCESEEIDLYMQNSSSNQVVKDLACALLQVSQGIEAKFLSPPLGESDAFKKQKQKALNDLAKWEANQKNEDSDSEKEQSFGPDLPKSPLIRWQESLMRCNNLSQLFVHLGTLERSVAWSRSVLKAHCKICRRRGDAENMLLCDGCNRGHHLYCLKPPLTEIPQNDWFCLSCKPPEKTVTPQKKRPEIDSDESEEESDEEEEENSYDEDVESEVDVENGVIPGYEVCESCGEAGTVICCDRCPLVYHPECIGLRRIPRGEWLCPKCTKKNEALKKCQKSSSSGAYSTRTQTLLNGQFPQNAPTLRTRIPVKGSKQNRGDSSDSESNSSKRTSSGTKRTRADSSDSDSYPPKRACSERRRNTPNSSERKKNTTNSAERKRSPTNDTDVENPFKKVYRDTNSSRRRSKNGGDDNMLDYKTCLDLLLELMHHPSSWPFLVPVSKKDAPDYHLIIKRPMDFGTIRSKLNNMNYTNNDDFVRDLYLVLQNCELFNPRSSPEYKAARALYKEVKRLLLEYQLPNTFSANVKQLTDAES